MMLRVPCGDGRAAVDAGCTFVVAASERSDLTHLGHPARPLSRSPALPRIALRLGWTTLAWDARAPLDSPPTPPNSSPTAAAAHRTCLHYCSCYHICRIVQTLAL